MKFCNSHSKTSDLLGLCSLVLVASGLGCSAGSEPSPALGSGGSPETSPECPNAPPCAGQATDGEGNNALCVQTVEADVVDEQGSPVTNFQAQVCGKNLCKAAKSDSSGHVRFTLCKNLFAPAFDIPGKSHYVSLAIPLLAEVSSLGTFTLVPLATAAEQLKTTPGKEVSYSSGGAALLVPAGSEVEMSEIDHPEVEDQKFRASPVESAQAPGLAESSPGLELFYGLAPTGAKLSRAASLTLPNRNKWPAGTSVEFFVQGVDFMLGGSGSASAWTSVGKGRVSDDGQTLSTEEGSGITFLGLVGVRRK